MNLLFVVTNNTTVVKILILNFKKSQTKTLINSLLNKFNKKKSKIMYKIKRLLTFSINLCS